VETAKSNPKSKKLSLPAGTKFYLKSELHPQVYYKDAAGVEHRLEFRDYGHVIKVHRAADRKKRVTAFTTRVNELLKAAGSDIVVKDVDVDNGRTHIGKLFASKITPEDAIKSLMDPPKTTTESDSSETTKSEKKPKKSKSKKGPKKTKKSKSKSDSTSGEDGDETPESTDDESDPDSDDDDDDGDDNEDDEE